MCLRNSRASLHVCLTAELFVLITEGRPIWQRVLFLNQQRIRESFQSAVRQKTPAAVAKHGGLSQVYCICQQQPFNTTGHRSQSSTERSFLLDVQLCERSSALTPFDRLSTFPLHVCVWTISMTSFPCEQTYLLSRILSSPLTEYASQKRGRGGEGYL